MYYAVRKCKKGALGTTINTKSLFIFPDRVKRGEYASCTVVLRNRRNKLIQNIHIPGGGKKPPKNIVVY